MKDKQQVDLKLAMVPKPNKENTKFTLYIENDHQSKHEYINTTYYFIVIRLSFTTTPLFLDIYI